VITGRVVSDEFEMCLVCANLVFDNLCDAMQCLSGSGLMLSKIVLRSLLAQAGH